MRHLVLVTLYDMQGAPCIPDSQPNRVTNTKCHIDTVIFPDDGHSRPKHVHKRNKHTKKNCAPSWLGFISKITQGCRSTKHTPKKKIQTQDLLNQHQYTPTCRFRRHALFLQKTKEICIRPRSVVAITLSLQCSLTFNRNLLHTLTHTHTHMKATYCRCKSLMLHKHTTTFLRKVRPLMRKSCPSFKRTNALIQYGNNFSAYDYLIELPFSLL